MSWLWPVFSMHLRKAFSYRVEFWINFLMPVAAEMVMAYFLWQAIFSYRGVDRIGGYSFASMMLYYLLMPLSRKLIRGQEMGFMSLEIYEGSLTRYLVYPVSFYLYKFVGHMAEAAVATFQLLVLYGAFLAVFGVPPDLELGLSGLTVAFLQGWLATLAAAYLYYSISTILDMVAFWAENVWSLQVMLRFIVALLGAELVPLSLYPEQAQTVLSWLPFTYLAYFPVQSFMGKVDWGQWALSLAVMACWAAVFTMIGRVVWRRGTHQYTGVGI